MVPKDSKLPTRLWLGLSHLVDQKFRHNFQDCVSPICYYITKLNNTSFSPSLPQSTLKTVFQKINQVSETISRQSHLTITKILLFSDNN